MASARRNSEGVPITVYEQQRREHIVRNKEKLQALKLPIMTTMTQPSKRRKKSHHTSDAAADGHNLRSRAQRNSSKIANDTNYEAIEEFLCDNEDLQNDTGKKRKGRGITKMNDIFSRTPNMAKIKITVNEFGQPVGANSRKLSSAIGCQVRKKLSVGCEDWRLVDPEKKLEVWTDIKSPRSEEVVDEAHHNAQGQEDACAENEDYDFFDDNLLHQRNTAALAMPRLDKTTTPRNDEAPRYAHDTLVGKEVILYAMIRSDVPVAKGTILSTNPGTIVGGEPLGKQFCEVVVDLVMRRDAELPRPYDHMESMAGAYKMSIAWPYNKLKVVNRGASSNKGSNPSQGAAGTVRGAR